MATARSGPFTPSKSTTATALGVFKNGKKVTGSPKLPPPWLSRTATVSDPELVTTRSGPLAPSRSPTATQLGALPPIVRLLAAPNEPVPSFRSTETLPVLEFATTPGQAW